MSPVYRPSDETERRAWNRFLAGHERSSLLQTIEWGELKSGFGWDWELVTLDGAKAPRAGAVVLYRQLPLNLGTIAYVPRGPALDFDDSSLVATFFEELHSAVRRHRAWACWIEPKILEGEGVEELLKSAGYKPTARTIQPRSTILVDLTPSEDDILMAMKSKTRYNIRLSARKGVTVRQGSVEDIDVFYDLMEETGQRDEFGIHSRAYYRKAFELFAAEDRVALFIAKYKGEPLASLLAFAVGTESWYISGASSNRHRNRMPAYAVQWAAIQWAKARGCTVYDLWGIPDADEETLEDEFTERSDGLWGVYRFKRGFGGEVVRYIGLWEHALHPLYPFARRLYEGVR
ncbi:MAG: lipid II:glycine glycyltransferase FemX [Anaerolineae bacterium]